MAPSHGAEADGKWPELPLAVVEGIKDIESGRTADGEDLDESLDL